MIVAALVVWAGNMDAQPAAKPKPKGIARDAPPPIHVTVTAPEKSPELQRQEVADRQREISIQEEMARTNARLLWVGLMQFLVAVFTGVAAWQAARAAHRSADATKASADAAQVSANAAKLSADALLVINRQWVDVSDWTCRVEEFSAGRRWAVFSVRVANKTRLPLTIVTVRCRVNRTKAGYEWSSRTLQPDGESNEMMTSVLTGEEAAAYMNDNLRMAIAGWVHFRDAFGDFRARG